MHVAPVNKTDVAREYHRKFPRAGTLTLARRMAREQPALFHDAEHARSVLRHARGNNGDRARAVIGSECFRPNGKPESGFDAIPDGLTEFNDWAAFRISGPCSALVISDVHVPYHDKVSLELALRDGKSHNVDIVLINGDFVDAYQQSKYLRDPRLKDFPGEVAISRQVLQAIRDIFPKARIIWKEGNHEERYEAYMKRSAPNLLGIDVFTPQSCYQMSDAGVEWVADKRPITLGKLFVLHGHEYALGTFNPVGAARWLFLRAGVSALIGHFHQTSQYSKTNLKGETISTWATGCLSQLHPGYRPLNDWNHGYALVEVDKRGAFEVMNKRIIDGRAY